MGKGGGCGESGLCQPFPVTWRISIVSQRPVEKKTCLKFFVLYPQSFLSFDLVLFTYFTGIS